MKRLAALSGMASLMVGAPVAASGHGCPARQFTLPIAHPSNAAPDAEVDVADTPVGRVALKVSRPTLTVTLPARKRPGPALLVIPGGAFHAVALGMEGDPVAAWLVAHHEAAAVLKYRLPSATPTDAAGLDAGAAPGIADARAALALMRANAPRWCIDPKRIGVIGFSAGGMIASKLSVADDGPKPDFLALIYGAPFGAMPKVRRAGPPTFMAWAKDDDIANGPATAFSKRLRGAGTRVETQVYDSGGHGFGLKRRGKPTDAWIDAFERWLRVVTKR